MPRKPYTPERKIAMSMRLRGIAKNPTGILIPRNITWRNNHLKRYHNKSIEQYNIDLQNQGNVCAVCLCPPKESETLVYDHDHKHCDSKKSCPLCQRKLLCHKCNRALGFFDDSIIKLESAIRYLKAHDKF